VDVLRWAALEVDAAGADRAGLTARAHAAAEAAVAEAEGRTVLARLMVRGETALHGALLDDTEALAAECRSAALGAGGQIWVEQVRLATRRRRALCPAARRPHAAARRGRPFRGAHRRAVQPARRRCRRARADAAARHRRR
jgi:hypothetical protein